MLLRPSDIRFSQDAISDHFKTGSRHGHKMIGDTLDDICEGRCDISDIPIISVKLIRDHWTTCDNRRLWVFRQLERLGKCTEIQVKTTNSIDPRKLSSRNGGVSVRVRRNGPGGVWHLKQAEQSLDLETTREQLQDQTSRTEKTGVKLSKNDSKAYQICRLVKENAIRYCNDESLYSFDFTSRNPEGLVNNDERNEISRSKERSSTLKSTSKAFPRTNGSSLRSSDTEGHNLFSRTSLRSVVDKITINESETPPSGFQEVRRESISDFTNNRDVSSPRNRQTQFSHAEKSHTSSLLNIRPRVRVFSTGKETDQASNFKGSYDRLIDRGADENIKVNQRQTVVDVADVCRRQSASIISNTKQPSKTLFKTINHDDNPVPEDKDINTERSNLLDRSVSRCSDSDRPNQTPIEINKNDESIRQSSNRQIVFRKSAIVQSKIDMKQKDAAAIQSKDSKSQNTTYAIETNLSHPNDHREKINDYSLNKYILLPKSPKSDSIKTNQRSQRLENLKVQEKSLHDVRQTKAHPIISGAVKERLQVAAIDFGTTYSGYAFSFRNDFLEDPLKIVTNQWTTGSNQSVSLKTSSCILFEPSGKFHSFGFDAEDMYADLAAEEKHNKWYFFKRFKMRLYEHQELSRRITLKDDNGNEMPAMKVFAESIKFLRHHFLDSCTDRQYGLEEDEIHWVLTVPAIWDDTAKLFMREAAIEAGIDSDHLSLALEPEAASMFCKHLPVNKIQGVKGAGITCFGPGTRYMVLDAGGGTVDITVHETQRDHTVKELYKANGGPWGGTRVDEAFNKFLTDISSPESLAQFKTAHMEDYLDIMREFEIKKAMTSPDMDQKITIKIPVSFHETYLRIHGDELRASRVVPAPLKLQISFTGDKLRVQPDVIQGFFGEVCQKIIDHLRDVFSKPEVRGTDTILMVGGFSESRMLQDAVRRNFHDKTVIIPAEAGLAVLKGAVIFGHNPKVITTRVSRFTYGISTYAPFKSGIHPIERKYEGEDGNYCKDTFDVHVNIGDQVDEGTTFETHSYFPLASEQTRMQLVIYTSDQTNPLYTDEPGCERKLAINVDLPHGKSKKDKEVTVFMKYGGVFLDVEATVVKTDEKANARLDFLE